MRESTGSGAVFTAIGLLIGAVAVFALADGVGGLNHAQAVQQLAEAYQLKPAVR